MSLTHVALAILATFGLSALLYYWKGFAWLHRIAKTDVLDENGESITAIGRQLSCFWCVSLWVSIPVSALAYFTPWALYPLALTGASILLAKGGRIIWASMQED